MPTDHPPPLPVPGLDGRRLTIEELEGWLPDRLEYIGGRLGGARYGPALLALLLANVGVREAVRLAPRETWLAALG